MRRRSGAGPERAKSRRRKTITQKRRGLRNASAADHKPQSNVAQLTRERDEALEREKATAEVLGVISSSPSELHPVFRAMLENATRICEANFGNIYRWDGDSLRLVATHNTPPAYAELRRSSPFRPGSETATGRMIATKSITHVVDLGLERGYAERDPLFVEGDEVGGIRTLL